MKGWPNILSEVEYSGRGTVKTMSGILKGEQGSVQQEQGEWGADSVRDEVRENGGGCC